MPQIAQILETYASQFFWMLLVFGILYFVIGRGMVSKIDANVEARDRKIADDLAAAEKARAEADGLVAGGSDALNAARGEAQAKAWIEQALGVTCDSDVVTLSTRLKEERDGADDALLKPLVRPPARGQLVGVPGHARAGQLIDEREHVVRELPDRRRRQIQECQPAPAGC